MDYGETVESAVTRELLEETGISAVIRKLVGVYSAPDRDPRRHNVSVAFLMSAAPQTPVGGDDAATAEFVSDWTKLSLAFDHSQMVADAVRLTG